MDGEKKKTRERTPSGTLLASVQSQESSGASSDSDTDTNDPKFKCVPCMKLFKTDAEFKKHERTQTHHKKLETIEKKKNLTSPNVGAGLNDANEPHSVVV